MKVIASNIFEFTVWYKFGQKHIPSDLIIDLADPLISGEELFKKSGPFEEEYDIFYLELPEEVISPPAQLFLVSLQDILSIIPLTEKGRKLLSSKIPDFKVAQPLSSEIAGKLFEARDRQVAIHGGDRLLTAFHLTSNDTIKKHADAFLPSLLKYFKDLNSEQDTMLDYVLFYERSKPYPLTDIGFLFDVGGIARIRYNITDKDLSNKDLLKETDPDKHEIIEEVIALSKFLQKKHTERLWSEFLIESQSNTLLLKLSKDLTMIDDSDELNNILIIAFYLKFRYLIRNTSSLDDLQFIRQVRQFLKHAPIESSIALYLAGMFFGSPKFKVLFYKHSPLPISLEKRVEPANGHLPYSSDTIKLPKLRVPRVIKENKNPIHSTPEPPLKINRSYNLAFDKQYWESLSVTTFNFTKVQQKLIKECFFDYIDSKKGLFEDQVPSNGIESFSNDFKSFIELLKNKMRKSKAKKPESKLSIEIIDKIHDAIKADISKY